jgi:hypothetical protein
MKTSKYYPGMTSSSAKSVIGILFLLLMSLSASADVSRIYVVSADEWARPRSGAVIAEFEALRAAVGYWDKLDNGLIVVRYPGEDSGELWAAELRDWLISLGVPSDYIRLVAGTQAADEIRLLVGNRDELEQ